AAGIARHYSLVIVLRAAILVIAVAVIAPAVQLHATPPRRTQIAPGAVVWRAGAVVLDLDGRVDAEQLLEGLRRAGARGIDITIVRTDGRATEAAVDALRNRDAIRTLWSPSTIREPRAATIGRLAVSVRPAGDRLTVEIEARGPPV